MSKFKFFEIIISIILFFVTSIFSKDINGYSFIYILPLGYAFCRLLFIKIYDLEKRNIAIKAIHLISFIKYSLMPCIITITSDYYNGVLTGQVPSAEALEKAIWFIFYEMIFVFATVDLSGRLCVKKNKDNDKSLNIKKRTEIQPVFIMVLAIGVFFTVIFSNYLLPRQLFLLNENYSVSKQGFAFDGAVQIIYSVFKLVVLLLLLRHFFEKYEKEKLYRYIIGSGIVMIAFIGIQTSISRWNIVIPVIIYLYLAKDYFKDKMKIIFIVVGVVLAISFLSISAYKFSWLLKNDGSNFIKEMCLIYTKQLQEYFSGPRATAQGIEAVEIYREQITGETLINDYLGSVPLLSHFINQKDRINIYYNYLLKGIYSSPTQIMPMIAIGYAYFGKVLSVLFIVIHIVIAVTFGKKEYESNDIFYKYLYAYAGIWFSMALMFNTQIVFGWFISGFVPMIIVLNFNKYIVIKKRGYNK